MLLHFVLFCSSHLLHSKKHVFCRDQLLLFFLCISYVFHLHVCTSYTMALQKTKKKMLEICLQLAVRGLKMQSNLLAVSGTYIIPSKQQRHLLHTGIMLGSPNANVTFWYFRKHIAMQNLCNQIVYKMLPFLYSSTCE